MKNELFMKLSDEAKRNKLREIIKLNVCDAVSDAELSDMMECVPLHTQYRIVVHAERPDFIKSVFDEADACVKIIYGAIPEIGLEMGFLHAQPARTAALIASTSDVRTEDELHIFIPVEKTG